MAVNFTAASTSRRSSVSFDTAGMPVNMFLANMSVYCRDGSGSNWAATSRAVRQQALALLGARDQQRFHRHVHVQVAAVRPSGRRTPCPAGTRAGRPASRPAAGGPAVGAGRFCGGRFVSVRLRTSCSSGVR